MGGASSSPYQVSNLGSHIATSMSNSSVIRQSAEGEEGVVSTVMGGQGNVINGPETAVNGMDTVMNHANLGGVPGTTFGGTRAATGVAMCAFEGGGLGCYGNAMSGGGPGLPTHTTSVGGSKPDIWAVTPSSLTEKK